MTNFEKIKNMTIDELSQFLLQRDSYVRLFGSSSKWAISDWLEKDVAVCERFKDCLHKNECHNSEFRACFRKNENKK